MRTTIKHIATRLGLSVNTVSKALSGRPQVSEKTRELIIKTAAEMNYVPNISARALARKKISIAAVYPLEPGEFYFYLAEGIKKTAPALADLKCAVVEYPYSSIESPDDLRAILIKVLNDKVDGLVITCCHRFNLYRNELASIAAAGIPILYNTIFGEDMPGVIGGIRTNTIVAGRIAAEFLGMTIHKAEKRKVALLVGEKNLLVHRECIEGFCVDAPRYNLDVVDVCETYGEDELAYQLTERLLRLYPDLGGIYVTSHNSTRVCDRLEEQDRENKIHVIEHDLYPRLNDRLRSGLLSATIFQNQYEFGRESVLMMADYLEGTRNKDGCLKLVTPQVVYSCMVDTFPYYDKPI